MIETPITKMLGIKYPLFQGGMAWIADGCLASAVSNAGGLGIIAAELLAAKSGLGYMIQVARNFGRADLVIVGMLTIGMLGALLTVFLEFLEKKFVKGRARK